MFCCVLKTLGDMNSRRGICSEISGANLPRHSPGKWQSICKEQWKCWENSVASWLGPRDKAVNKMDAGHLELLCSYWAFISHRTLSSPSNLGRKNFLAAFLGQQPVSLLPSSWGGGPVRAQGWLRGLMEVASSQCAGLVLPARSWLTRACACRCTPGPGGACPCIYPSVSDFPPCFWSWSISLSLFWALLWFVRVVTP